MILFLLRFRARAPEDLSAIEVIFIIIIIWLHWLVGKTLVEGERRVHFVGIHSSFAFILVTYLVQDPDYGLFCIGMTYTLSLCGRLVFLLLILYHPQKWKKKRTRIQ